MNTVWWCLEQWFGYRRPGQHVSVPGWPVTLTVADTPVRIRRVSARQPRQLKAGFPRGDGDDDEDGGTILRALRMDGESVEDTDDEVFVLQHVRASRAIRLLSLRARSCLVADSAGRVDMYPCNMAGGVAAAIARIGLAPLSSQRSLEGSLWVLEDSKRCTLRLRNKHTGMYLRVHLNGALSADARSERAATRLRVLHSLREFIVLPSQRGGRGDGEDGRRAVLWSAHSARPVTIRDAAPSAVPAAESARGEVLSSEVAAQGTPQQAVTDAEVLSFTTAAPGTRLCTLSTRARNFVCARTPPPLSGGVDRRTRRREGSGRGGGELPTSSESEWFSFERLPLGAVALSTARGYLSADDRGALSLSSTTTTPRSAQRFYLSVPPTVTAVKLSDDVHAEVKEGPDGIRMVTARITVPTRPEIPFQTVKDWGKLENYVTRVERSSRIKMSDRAQSGEDKCDYYVQVSQLNQFMFFKKRDQMQLCVYERPADYEVRTKLVQSDLMKQYVCVWKAKAVPGKPDSTDLHLHLEVQPSIPIPAFIFDGLVAKDSRNTLLEIRSECIQRAARS